MMRFKVNVTQDGRLEVCNKFIVLYSHSTRIKISTCNWGATLSTTYCTYNLTVANTVKIRRGQ